VSSTTGLTENLILEWVNRADLMRVKGIGEEYSDLLEASGVGTVKELRTRKAVTLHARMVEINDKKRLVRRLPTEDMVAGWIAGAAKLPSAVKY